tara:strand:- start:88 stop:540 length:453 start_codon:yes stop_codon:yes gene_type:complete
MRKDINNITEELIMRYVEGKMSHQESKSFEDMLNKNEYLKERVDVLKNIFINQPEQSPSMSVHNDILKKLNIDAYGQSHEQSYFNSFFEKLSARPVLMASAIGCITIMFFVLSFNNSQNSDLGREGTVVSKDKIEENSELADKEVEDKND